MLSPEAKVILKVISVIWVVFALFALGLLFSSWLKRREQRKRKGHRRKHKEWA